MSIDAIISALSIAGTLVGTFAGIVFSIKLTIYRIEQLVKKVEKHNRIVVRTFILEGRMNEAEHDIQEMKGGEKK